MSVFIDTSGIEGLNDLFDSFPVKAKSSMANAINDTTRGFAMKLAKERIMKESNFPPGYLDDASRMDIPKLASPEDLVATIRGRDRPTSLLRFATGPSDDGMRVEVNPGDVKDIPDGFIINLRGGNQGLAIRLKPGQTLHNFRGAEPVQIFPNVYLLYAPSVDQVFRDVAEDISPDIAAELEREFIRRFNVAINP